MDGIWTRPIFFRPILNWIILSSWARPRERMNWRCGRIMAHGMLIWLRRDWMCTVVGLRATLRIRVLRALLSRRRWWPERARLSGRAFRIFPTAMSSKSALNGGSAANTGREVRDGRRLNLRRALRENVAPVLA